MSQLKKVAFGPVMPGWGSWDWVGADLIDELAQYSHTDAFTFEGIPDVDVIVIVKHAPPPGWFDTARRQAVLVYCPIDCYDSAQSIHADQGWLRQLQHVVIHCHRLREYFAPYAPVTYLDHHLKFITPALGESIPTGPILWVGVQTNLTPLVEWVNHHVLPASLLVLTNFGEEEPVTVRSAGFREGTDVTIQRWTPQRHLQSLRGARAALDIKGGDFRSRHKPPAKALDYLAAGLPLAMNPDSSPAEHLAGLGLEVANPEDTQRWLSPEYAAQCRRLGAAVRGRLTRHGIGCLWWDLLERLTM